jgi:hypothetical protein
VGIGEGGVEEVVRRVGRVERYSVCRREHVEMFELPCRVLRTLYHTVHYIRAMQASLCFSCSATRPGRTDRKISAILRHI